jgi:hypothetical protein
MGESLSPRWPPIRCVALAHALYACDRGGTYRWLVRALNIEDSGVRKTVREAVRAGVVEVRNYTIGGDAGERRASAILLTPRARRWIEGLRGTEVASAEACP